MGLKQILQPNKPAEDKKPEGADLHFSKQELELLLNGLAEASFTGRQLETLYKLVIKLQQAHMKL